MQMSLIFAFCVVLGVLSIGDVISAKTKAFVPSVFVAALLFLFGFWTFFPADIVTLAGLGGPITTLSMLLLITHMGTMMSIKELAGEWKTISIAVIGIVGIALGTLTIGRMLFGWEAVVIATPPLTGGIVAALVMSEAAAAKGLTELSVLAILMYVAQGFVGYPITALMLKKEGKRLLGLLRTGEAHEWNAKKAISGGNGANGAAAVAVETKSKFRIFPKVSDKYNTTYVIFLRLGLVAWAAVSFAAALNGVISQWVVCLFFGVIAAEIGFVDRKPLNLSSSFGFFITALMAFVFAGLARATPEMVGRMAGPLVGIIVLGVAGMAVLAILLGKFLGYTKEMSFAIALTALYGFPPTYILPDEASKALAENKEEYDYLMDCMLPKMLVGGFTTVTIASVIIAGIFVKFL